jgi:L-asparaginase II
MRGNLVESIHFGSIAVVDSDGKMIASYGDPHMVAFLRSSAKPFQALPFVERGGVEHYGYSKKELSLACASHEGARIHLDTVKEMQAKIGIEEDNLQCGGHLPGDPEMFKLFIHENIPTTHNTNNCSGKHTTMLAHAKMRNLPLDNYLDANHPIQKDILNTLAEMCSIERDRIQLGIDGCSAPNFALPLFNTAMGVARICDPRNLSEARATACKKITDAMTSFPEMVSNHGEFDCELMKVGAGRIITKRGAEGFQIVGVLPDSPEKRGIGVAFKVVDGDASRMSENLEHSSRVRPAVVLEVLKQLGVLNEAQLRSLDKFGPQKTIKNYAGLVTGKSYPVFKLA